MLRSSIIRAARSSASILPPSTAARPAFRLQQASPLACVQHQQVRSAHAISNPTLANIEKRWEDMPPQEQADLWMALRDRMKVDWKEMTMQEKKAAYWIAFGPHGPRKLDPPGQGRQIFIYSVVGVAAGVVIFYIIRLFANPVRPRTMTKEWQEATEEYLKAQGTEPITGYKGMYVQSPPGPPGQPKTEDE